MIYLFDVYKRLKHTIPSNQIVSATYTQELNALYTFDSELPLFYKDAKTGAEINLKAKFEESNYVGHFDTQGKFHLYKIYTIKVDGDMLVVKGVHIFFDEAKSTTVLEDVRLVDLGAREMFNTAFKDTGWSVKNYDNTPLASQDFYKVVPLEARAIIIEKFKVEIHPYLEFDGQKITGKYADVKTKLGSEVGQRFAYGHNAFNVTHEQNRAEIYTAVIGRGAPNGLNNVKETRVEFHNISWSKASGNPADKPAGSNILELPERTAEYGHVMADGTIKPRIGYVTFDDITDASVLLDETYKWINENSRPKFIAESTVDQIGNASLGDKINFIYKKIELYFSVRIFKVVYDLLDHNNTAVELGDYDFFNTDKAAERIQGEIKRVERLSNSFISDQKATFDAEFEEIKNEFNDKLNQAEVEAQQQIQAAETRMTNDLNAQRDSLSTDITNSYNNAVSYADNTAQALQTQVANDINTAKTTLTNDINNAYNNAVSQAQAKVDAAKSDMTATITANKQDADSKISTLNTALGDANTKIDATNTQVSSLVGDLSQYKTSTNSQLSTLNTQFTDINGQLTTVKSDILKNAGDISSVKTTVSSHTADITNLNNQIVLKASKTEVSDAVNALQIGVRNWFVVSTAQSNKCLIWTSGLYNAEINSLSSDFITVQANDTFTCNYPIDQLILFDVNKNIIDPGKVTIPGKSFSIKNDVNVAFMKIAFRNSFLNGTTKELKHVMLVKGTKMTDWVPAIEDTDAHITKNTADIIVNANEIAKRVLQTDYNALTGQMQTQINTATSTAQANTATIAVINGDIDNIEAWQVEKGTTIQQTADAISQKIWNSDIDSKTGVINDRLNTVSSTVDSNTATILQHTTQINGLQSWQSEKGAIITQNQNAISTKVWQTDITSAVDTLKVGTRNLFVNSTAKKDNALVWSSGAYFGEVGSVASDFIAIQANDKILSNYAMSQIIYFDDVKAVVDVGGNKGGNITSHTVFNDSRIKYMKVAFRSNFLNGQTIADKKIMIVKGTKLGDYTLAPEDTDARITKAEADITINKDAINQRVTLSDYNAKTGELTTSINNVKQTADSNTAKITTNTNAINGMQEWQNEAGSIIDQTNSAITNKVWNTDINNATGELQTQINTVKQTSDSNTALITTVKGTVDNLDAWKTAKGSLIDQTINAVSTKVWTNDINAIEIGNRNLIRQANFKDSSNTLNLWTILNGGGHVATKVIVDDTRFTKVLKHNLTSAGVAANAPYSILKMPLSTTLTTPENYTFVAWMKADAQTNIYQLGLSQGTTISGTVINANLSIGTEWQLVKFTTSFVAGRTIDNVYLCLERNETASSIYIAEPMLVKGSIAPTSFVTAPEDAENKMTEIKQTADSALLQANAIGSDYVKQSAVVVQADGVLIGSKKVSGTEMASAISVTPSNVDIITRVMRVTGDMQVAGDIKSLSLSAVYADIANLRANVITADSVTATALKVDQALIDKLNVNNLLVNKLTADTAMINAMKTNALTAVHADVAWLKANVITADSITATALKVDQALIDKLNVNDLLVNKIVASTVYSDSVKTKSLEAVNANIASIRTNLLVADVIQPSMLDMRNGGTAWIDRLFVDEATITALTSKNAFIQNIKAIDIDFNRARGYGAIGTNYIEITGDQLTQYGTYTRTWDGVTQTQDVYSRLKNGYLRFRNNTLDRSLYYSDFGISTYVDGDSTVTSGTLQFFDYKYSTSGTARGVTLMSDTGAVALRSNASRIVLDADNTVNIESRSASVYIRPMIENIVGKNEFRFWVKDNASASDTDGVISYGSITSGSTYGSGIRFDKSSSTTYVYATNNNGDIGTGDFYARYLYGDWITKSTNLYAMTNDELRITDLKGYNGGSPVYKDLHCKAIQSESIRTTSTNFYIGTSTGEVRITNNLLYNGGDIGYQDLRCKDIYALGTVNYGALKSLSSEKYKENIELWNVNASEMIRDTEIYSYNYIHDLDRGDTRKRHSVIIERETPNHIILDDGIDLNETTFTLYKALKEQIIRNDKLEEKINKLEGILNV